MENSNFKKQAKSDIFKELYPIINFYIKKGAKPKALKKYYKNGKRFKDLLDDIKNKGINLVKDETEYKKLVKEILNDILNDFIAKEKDEEYKNKQNSKMKHIKEFYTFEMNEELTTFQSILLSFAAGYCVYKFMKGLLSNIRNKYDNKKVGELEGELLSIIATWVETCLDEGGKIKFSEDYGYYTFEIDNITIKINKLKRYLTYNYPGQKIVHEIPVTQEEIDELVKSLKEENN